MGRSDEMSSMQSANRLQKALKKGGPTFGVWQMLPGANLSRAIARTGVDWICVDGEHGNIDDSGMHECVAAIAGCGVSPIARVAANEHWMIKRVLDAGAHGVCVPLIYTAEDARRVAAATKFPPVGTRGFGSPFAMESFNAESSVEYLQQANDAIVTIVQIETKQALENVNAIAAVPGIDVLLIGPFDLGNSIGRPVLDGTMHPDLHDAINRIHHAALDHGKCSSMFCTTGEQAREYADRGFHMICIAADIFAVSGAIALALATAQGGTAQERITGPHGR